MPKPIDPDDKSIYEALREARESNVPKAIPYTAELRIRDVTSANLIAQFMAKLDAQNAKLDAQSAKLDAQNAKLDAFSAAQNFQLRTLMWMIGAAVALIGIIVRLWG